jgi:uncharacterized protein (TIGR02265 family)
MAWREPDYTLPIDLEGLIRQLPPNAESIGFFMTDLLRQVRAKEPSVDLFERANLPRRTYIPFVHYPQEEWLRLHYHAALVLFPDVTPGEALRRLGRTAFDAFYATAVGRHLMSLIARDPQQLLLHSPMAYRLCGNFGKVTCRVSGERLVCMSAREVPEFVEYHCGVIEGGLARTGNRAILRVDVLAFDAADLEIRWEPQSPASHHELATAPRTSAGVTAALEIALQIIEEEEGRERALDVAQWLVMYLRRAGEQGRMSPSLARQSAESEPISATLVWASEHLADDLSVEALAHRAGMSRRNFSRSFAAETGTSPAAYIEQLRIEEAKHLLETTRRSIKEVALATGFRSAAVLGRAFRRLLGITPAQHRHGE